MKLQFETTTAGVDWQSVQSLLLNENMASYSVEKHRIAFENSSQVIFVYDNEKLIACGRLLTDGSYQGVLYDIVVHHNYQGHGLGKTIVTKLLEGQDDKNILLYASPGKEGFYKALGFRMSKTAMCRFLDMPSALRKGLIE